MKSEKVARGYAIVDVRLYGNIIPFSAGPPVSVEVSDSDHPGGLRQ